MPDRRVHPATAPEECANCGAAIPRGAKACPECGADERSGWRETDLYDGLDLPEDTSAAGGARPRSSSQRVNGMAWYWWLIAIVLVLLLVFAIR